MRKLVKQISIVIPAFNEEKNISLMEGKINSVINGLFNYEIVFVDDGSTDNTLKEIIRLSKVKKTVKYISFSRNFGHQSALKAGIDFATGGCVITMDCDLQHPPELIPEMIKRWQEGNDVVYTVRNDNKTPFFKRTTSNFFYVLINRLSSIHIDPGAADFRLLDRKVVDVIKNLNESVIFLRGLISWCGFKQYSILYEPNKRLYGQTKYSFKKMLFFALDGITSFSIKPLRLSILMGFVLSLFSGFYAIFALIAHLFHFQVISGWTSMIISVLFLGGIQLIILGIFGEYLGKLFLESKKRPLYIIDKKKL